MQHHQFRPLQQLYQICKQLEWLENALYQLEDWFHGHWDEVAWHNAGWALWDDQLEDLGSNFTLYFNERNIDGSRGNIDKSSCTYETCMQDEYVCVSTFKELLQHISLVIFFYCRNMVTQTIIENEIKYVPCSSVITLCGVGETRGVWVPIEFVPRFLQHTPTYYKTFSFILISEYKIYIAVGQRSHA